MFRWPKAILFCAFFAGIVVESEGQIVVPSSMRHGSGMGRGVRAFKSQNGKSTVSLDDSAGFGRRGTSQEVKGTVQPAMGGEPWMFTLWMSFEVEYLADNDVYVSDEGDLAVVAIRGGSSLHVFKPDKTSFGIAISDAGAGSVFQSSRSLFWKVDRIGGRRVIAYWDRESNFWRAYNATDSAIVLVPEKLGAKWDEDLRAQILDRLQNARRDTERLRLAKWPAPIAHLIGGATPVSNAIEVREGDYEFLVKQRNPKDRSWIESLLRPPNEYERTALQRASFYRGAPLRQGVNLCYVTDYQRLVGDWLLAIWDKRITNAVYGGQHYRSGIQRFRLGQVKGRINLPALFKPHAPNNGSCSIRLLPAGVSNPEKDGRREEASFTGNFFAQRPYEPSNTIDFAFTTVLPGKYQLKVVWDKRKPWNRDGKATPGDYESKLSAPIEVRAGEIVSGLRIECTNRVGGAENYYRADELEMKLNR